jgi:hypothetical protein
MPRIQPLGYEEVTEPVKKAFEEHVKKYQARITNMKSTLGHSLIAFEVYMQWYPLYRETEKILGKRLAYLYAYSISYSSSCPLCSTFFRKIIIDAGESPQNLQLSTQEQQVLNFGSAIANYKGLIADHLYNMVSVYYSTQELVVLVAFAGQMIATNIFNNVIETDIDEYLEEYASEFLKLPR